MLTEFELHHELFRAIHPSHWSFVDDRPSTATFKDPEMSVDWSKFTTVEESLKRYIDGNPPRTPNKPVESGIASITVELARSLNQEIRFNPIAENNEKGDIPNPSHTLVIGKKARAITRKFANECSVIIRVRYKK